MDNICEEKRELQRVRAARLRADCKARGVCYRCGQPARVGGLLCEEHRLAVTVKERTAPPPPCTRCGLTNVRAHAWRHHRFCPECRDEGLKEERAARIYPQEFCGSCPYCKIWGHTQQHCVQFRLLRARIVIEAQDLIDQGLSYNRVLDVLRDKGYPVSDCTLPRLTPRTPPPPPPKVLPTVTGRIDPDVVIPCELLSTRARSFCSRRGVRTINELARLQVSGVQGPNVGRTTIRVLADLLGRYGLTFRSPEKG